MALKPGPVPRGLSFTPGGNRRAEKSLDSLKLRRFHGRGSHPGATPRLASTPKRTGRFVVPLRKAGPGQSGAVADRCAAVTGSRRSSALDSVIGSGR